MPDETPNLEERVAAMNRSTYAVAAHQAALARHRLTLGLVLFLLVSALLMGGVPPLRNRLTRRVWELRGALVPEHPNTTPAVAVARENKYEFPVELERPTPKNAYPGVVQLPGIVFRPHGEAPPRAVERRGDSAAREPATDEPRGPEFKQGAAEKEAYDFLLKSHEGMAGLVRGTNASLRFKTWSAARAEDESFLVDVTFSDAAAGGTEVHYVWKVKPSTQEVSPLSDSARSLARP
jgi:hypothetical protein